jgi:hypothetical protein
MSADLSYGLVINAKMDTHPAEYKAGSKYFLRYVSFLLDNNEHVVIDLGDLSIYQEIGGSLTLDNSPSLSNIAVSPITAGDDTIKGLVPVFKNNSNATYRTVTIRDGLTFYCIKLPDIKNIPSMVYLYDDVLLDWNNIFNVVDGTYYNKRTFTVVNNFTTIMDH